jgi:hypothetical protein
MPELFLQFDESNVTNRSRRRQMSDDELIAMLEAGDYTAQELVPWGSNYSFAVALDDGSGEPTLAIYKPRSGEAPLYDFPDGTLYLRETAAYLLSRRLGWNLVPPTIVRDGPHGIGSVQLYVEPKRQDGDPHRFWGRKIPEIERLVLFDHITNNADRKLSHCLVDRQDKIWGIDHGLTFNEVPKLRTVLWQFVGSPISPGLIADLRRLVSQEPAIRTELAPYLTTTELDAFFARVERFIRSECYPRLNPQRNVPYGWW